MARGNYFRHNAKVATDELPSFSISELKRLGHVRPGCYALSWSRRGESVGSIAYDLTEDSITIRYTTTPPGGQAAAVRVFVPFTFTPCRYGGRRKWFLCRCGRAVVRLFIQGPVVACRHCLNLAYSSQREDRLDRLNRKIEKQLRGGKPKGMHEKTWQRKLDYICRLEVEKDQVFEALCFQLFPKLLF